jgi:hypothetical protein
MQAIEHCKTTLTPLLPSLTVLSHLANSLKSADFCCENAPAETLKVLLLGCSMDIRAIIADK